MSFATKLADSIHEMDNELCYLRRRVAELEEYEQKYVDLLHSSISSSGHVLGGLLSLAMKPGVMDAIGKTNNKEEADALHPS